MMTAQALATLAMIMALDDDFNMDNLYDCDDPREMATMAMED